MAEPLSHNERFCLFLAQLAAGRFGDCEFAQSFSGKSDNGIQYVVRDRWSARVHLIEQDIWGGIISTGE